MASEVKRLYFAADVGYGLYVHCGRLYSHSVLLSWLVSAVYFVHLLCDLHA